ncbi:MAG: P-II family nitrogen regulator [Candidatus Firestonebacteria bacterium]
MLKKIDCIVKQTKMDEIIQCLSEANVGGVTVSEVKGFGLQRGYTGDKKKVTKAELLPKVRIEIIVEEEEVEKIISIVQQLAQTGKVGDGKIFVLPVEDVVRIRTKERGELAIK